MEQSVGASRPRRSLSRTLATFGLLAVSAAVIFSTFCDMGHSASRSGSRHAAVGARLGEFQLDALTSDSDLSSDELHGKVTVLNFWGPWCVYCRLEMPMLAKLEAKLSQKENFRFVSVSYPGQPGESLARLKSDSQSILRNHGAKFPAYADTRRSLERALAKTARFQGLVYPTTLVVDQQGTIRGVWEGYSEGDMAQIETLVNQHLAEKLKTSE